MKKFLLILAAIVIVAILLGVLWSVLSFIFRAFFSLLAVALLIFAIILLVNYIRSKV